MYSRVTSRVMSASVAVRCSVLQCVAVCCSVLQSQNVFTCDLSCYERLCCSVLQCVAVSYSVMQCQDIRA